MLINKHQAGFEDARVASQVVRAGTSETPSN